MIAPHELPWNIPVPLTTATGFIPLHPNHKKFAMTTDLSRIGGFSFQNRNQDIDTLGYADLQTNVDINALGRLGSGRSVFYNGKYLKGSGRTPLAANWNNPNDIYHNSGHLFASGAAREFISSYLMRAVGRASGIVACEGVLVSHLAPHLSGVLAASIPRRNHLIQHRNSDECLQAITIKPGNFARYSNIVWLWNTIFHGTDGSYVADAVRFTYEAFSGFHGCIQDSQLTPEFLIDSLESAIRTGVNNCLDFIDVGVFWGSFHNNFSADGRFIDLELPTFTGGNFLGAASVSDCVREYIHLPASAINVGTEIFSYIRQTQMFIKHWQSRLRQLAGPYNFFGDIERQFVLETADYLESTFTADHFVFNRDLLVNMITSFYNDRLRLRPQKSHLLSVLLTEAHTAFFNGIKGPDWEFIHMPVDLPDAEPGVQFHLYYPSFLRDSMPCELTTWQAEANELLREADCQTDPYCWIELLRSQQVRFGKPLDIDHQTFNNNPDSEEDSPQ